jgi:dTDP-4-dehydrorhamnose 3,5-epimerase
MLEQARRAPATMTEDWQPVAQPKIAGFALREIKNVVFRNGVLTELFREEWFDPPMTVRHAVHIAMIPGGITSWHYHKSQRDIIVPVQGQIRLGLYDDRPESPTRGTSLVLHIGIMRPTCYHVPPGVWHSLKNPTQEFAAYVVLNDETYVYDDPDDWILPAGAPAIPCKLD